MAYGKIVSMSVGARRLSRTSYTPAISSGLVVGRGSLAIGTANYAVPVDGTARFVSPSGSNSNSGTEASPWLTFEYALANTAAGGTIVLRAGTYHEGKVFINSSSNNNSGYVALSTGNANLTIQNYPGEEVWFDGSSLVSSWTVSGSFWYASWTPLRRDLYTWASTYPVPVDDNNTTNGWGSLDNSTVGWTYVDYSDTTRACAGRPERVWKRVKGSTDENAWVALTQVEYVADMATDTFYGDAYNNRLYIGANPSTYDIRVTDRQTLFNSIGANTTMRGIGFRRYAPSLPQWGCLKFHRPNGVLENCTFEDISGVGVSVIGSTTNTGANNITVNRCTFRRIGDLGLHIDQIDYAAVTDCRFEYCNDKLFNPAPSAGAVKVSKMRYFTGTRNLYYYTHRGKGFWSDVDCQSIYEINSDFIGCEQRGAVYELTNDVHVLGCRFKDLGESAIVFMDSEGSEVWNCSFYNIGLTRGQVMGADTNSCAGIAVFTDARTPRESSRITYYDQRITNGTITWGGNATGGYWMSALTVRNCVFGPANYEAYWRDQVLGADAGSAPSIIREYTADGLDFDRNYYNGYATGFQVASRTYPYVLRRSNGSNYIYYNPTNLRSNTTANPAGALEQNGVEYTDVNRCDAATGMLNSSYQTAANAMAQPISASVAAQIGVSTGTTLMGPLARV